MTAIRIGVLAACAGLAGWMVPATAGIFSSTGPVIAILDGDLFRGEAEGHLDGSGTVRIQSRAKPDFSCQGQFTSSKELGGAGSLKCSDGAIVSFRFKRLSVTRGHGSGSSPRGLLSFTYGLTPDEAGRYLTAPPGKALRLEDRELVLLDAR